MFIRTLTWTRSVLPLLICTLGFLLSSPALAQERDGDAPASFDAAAFDTYVQQAMEDWDVPGLAIAIVKDDSVVFAQGYGVREVGPNEPVDTETLFAIGSTTKAMVTAAIGMLVDEGALGWEDPVVEHLPWFRLKDPYLTTQITVRDLVTHRAGLPNTDFMWIDPNTSMEEIVRRLQHVEATYELRDGFIYQNVMYAVAGAVIEAVSGMAWDDFIQTRIFEPLGMERSVTTLAEAEARTNVARPHALVDDEVIVISSRSVDPVGPAGSIWSSVDDMARWIAFLLRGCETEDGDPLLEAAQCRELFTPQVVLRESMYPTAQLTEPAWVTYGLGWFQQDYRGRKTDFHTGSIDGMNAIAGLILDEHLGVYVLINRRQAELRHALMYRVFDLFDEEEPRDWSAELKELYDALGAERERELAAADSAMQAQRAEDTTPSLPLQAYAGTYKDPLYGAVEVQETDEGLRLDFGGASGRLEHWHHDTFRLHYERPARTNTPLITIDLSTSGEPERLRMQGMEFRREVE